MKLNDKAVQAAKPKPAAYKLADGDGLYLEVRPTGAKYWRLKYRFLGTERRLAFGVYPEVTLADARARRWEARELLKHGKDPSAVKKEVKAQAVAAIERQTTNTFMAVVKDWHTHNTAGWTERHAGYVWRRLEKDIFPLLGTRPIDEISPKDVIAVLHSTKSTLFRHLTLPMNVDGVAWPQR